MFHGGVHRIEAYPANILSTLWSIVTPATNFNLTTRETVKRELELKSNDRNLWLEEKIRRVSGTIADDCRRIFALQTYSETFRETYARSLMLREYPIANIVVTENGVVLTAGTDYEVVGGAISSKVGPAEVFRMSNGFRYPWPYLSTVVVQYDGGYALPGSQTRNLPSALEDVAVRLVKSAYLERKRDAALRSYEIPGVISQTYWVSGPGESVFPPDIAAQLDPYRRDPIFA